MANEAGSDRKLQDRPFGGILLMIVGLALYPLTDAFMKHMMGSYPVAQTNFLRAMTRLIPLLIALFLQGGPKKIFATSRPKDHLLRLCVNLAYTYGFMIALWYGSLTTIYTISYTSPFFMILLSALILKEKVSWGRWVAVAIGMIGVLIAIKPGTNVVEWAAILVLIATFLGVLNKILMRRLAETEHSLAITIYPNFTMMLVTFPFLLTTWKSMPWDHWGAFTIVGCLTAAGQYAIAQALRYTQGSTLAPLDYSTYLWVVALDFFWWQRSPDLFNIVGAAVIVGSNLYILYCTKRDQIKKSSVIIQ